MSDTEKLIAQRWLDYARNERRTPATGPRYGTLEEQYQLAAEVTRLSGEVERLTEALRIADEMCARAGACGHVIAEALAAGGRGAEAHAQDVDAGVEAVWERETGDSA